MLQSVDEGRASTVRAEGPGPPSHSVFKCNKHTEAGGDREHPLLRVQGVWKLLGARETFPAVLTSP